ncbi:maternal effect protein oskar [Malaya genurostris]|uniref:maternal effect protein oskar n=1 Tax=Malaya genurostris TaxID=325434 RepID=UPI0026F3A9DB|nr:maternal effect protein oskar [Malaya genurostris]
MFKQHVRVSIESVTVASIFRIYFLILHQIASMISVENNQINDVSATRSEGVNMEEVITILRSIIVSRSKEGATIDEIIDDYKDHTGESLLSTYRDRDIVAAQLRQIEGVWSTFAAPNGPYLWYCNTRRTQHLTDMIKKQKSPRISNRKYQNSRYQIPSTPYSTSTKVSGSDQREKFFEDNMNFIPKRNAWSRVQVRVAPYLPPQRRQLHQGKQMTQRRYYSNVPNMGPNFCGYQMVGDDFFLSLARWELGFDFDPGHSIQQSGLCISGLTIAEAADRVLKATYINERVIVNIGAVDLLHGYDFVDMQHDLFQLMKNLEIRGASVILTTISPMANSSHIPGIIDRLQKFNSLVRRHHWKHIDLWQCFVNEKGNTLYECFQPGPRHVSGSNQPHVLWNKLGRQRIIKFLKQHLAAFI